MKDINHLHPEDVRTEGDGVSYKGLAWSMIILTIITLFCYALIVGVYKCMESRAVENDATRSPLAAAPVRPTIVDGRVVGGSTAPVPSLLVNEPINLQKFRSHEEEILTTYGWVDQNAGTVRLPIDRAKALLLERGIAVRESR